MLPLVLDDVLVNFDRDRAVCAAKTLQTFAELGHQVMMFTCHQHIVDIFHDIEVQVRMMPTQGTPGRATILEPELEYEEEEFVAEEETIEEPATEEPILEEIVEEPAEELIVESPEESTEENTEESTEQEPAALPKPERAPSVIYVEQPKRQAPKVEHIKISHPEPTPEPSLGWAWFEDESDANDSVERLGEVEDALASITGGDWRENDLLQSPDDVPEEIWNRGGSWWGDSAPDDPASRTSLDQ
jgi:outer membrane biosynthesis protein TonB